MWCPGLVACEISLEQGWNLRPLHWQVGSHPLHHQGLCRLTKVDSQGSPLQSRIQEEVTKRIFYYFPSQGVSSELYFKAGVLPPPPPVKGSVPLYNPSQVPQVRRS